MAIELNEWYVSSGISISKDQINDRFNAIKSFYDNVSIEDICNLIKVYYGFPVDEEFSNKFVQSIIEFDATFSATYYAEIKLLAGATLAYIAENGYKLGYMVELLVLTRSYYHPPTSSIKIQEYIKKLFNEDRIELRKAKKCDIKPLKRLVEIKEKAENEEENWQVELIDFLIEQHNISNDLLKMLQIYKEDSQILWWMNSQWSNTLNCPLKNIKKEKACLLIGSEAADMIENYPGPYAIEAVIKNIVKNCKGTTNELEIENVISEADDNWKRTIVASSTKITFIDLLPIHSALIRSNNTTTKEQWYPKYEQEVILGNSFKKISQEDYAFRMYLEKLIIKLYFDIENKGEL